MRMLKTLHSETGMYTGYGILAILCWSTSVAFARSISETLGPLLSGAIVYLLSGCILVTHFIVRNKSIKNNLNVIKSFPSSYLLGCGSLFILNNVSLYLSIGLAETRSQALEVGLINYLWPILSILFSLVILSKKENIKASRMIFTGTLIALCGIFLVLTDSTRPSLNTIIANIHANPAAYAAAILAAVCWALYSNFTRLFASDIEIGAAPFFIFTTGLFLAVLNGSVPKSILINTQLLIEIFILTAATALSYLFWDISMRKGNVTKVLAFSYLTPFCSTLVAAVYLGISPGISLWVGVVCIIIGSFLSWKSIKPSH